MSILGELFLLLSLTLAAEGLSSGLGLPLPGPVLGMVLLLLLLVLKLIKPHQLEKTGGFLLGNLTFLFVPLVVSLRENTDVLETYGIKILILLVVTTLLVMAVTALTARFLLWVDQRSRERKTSS